MTQSYNLVDEQWIPVANKGKASLKQIFSDQTLQSLGGNAIQKVSILKFLLAIAQTACTPQDEYEWKKLEAEGLGKQCCIYLENKRNLFWLYGEKPFLQMPILEELLTKEKEPLPVSMIGRNYLPDLPSDNDSIVFQSQMDRPLSDAEKAVFIISIMNYSPGGKRTVKDMAPLSTGYEGKTGSAKPSPSLGNYVGYLNSCLWGETILDTVWLNLFSFDQLSLFPDWAGAKIIPPWENMPKGEDDEAARYLKKSFIATLCSLSRFVLLKDGGIIYAEGIQYPSHKNGWREPFISYTPDGKILWLDTSKKPWRNLSAILEASFNGNNSTFNCPQISLLFKRARTKRKTIGIWSGGLQVRATAGDQSVKQTDDFIESLVTLNSLEIGGEWFGFLRQEMDGLDGISRKLWGNVHGYCTDLSQTQKVLEGKATEMFWQLCERQFQHLVDSLGKPDKVHDCRQIFADYVLQTYNTYCPNDSARQMSAWAKNRPYLVEYLAWEKKEVAIG